MKRLRCGYDRAEVAVESQIELARRAIDAFNARNAEALIELGVLVYDWSGSIAPYQGVCSTRSRTGGRRASRCSRTATTRW
jgi:hypothetical protein